MEEENEDFLISEALDAVSNVMKTLKPPEHVLDFCQLCDDCLFICVDSSVIHSCDLDKSMKKQRLF